MNRGWRAHIRPLQGLTYLVVVALLVWLSIVAYNKAFPWQGTTDIRLVTKQVGLQLKQQADVKVKGINVGRVTAITSTGEHATLHLALKPAKAHLIPSNVDASIIPKTLFGAKYVNLIIPEDPSGHHIAEGAVITQSTTAVEISELFTNLESVLQTLKPVQLSRTLNSLASALQGRGSELGDTIELLHTYLSQLNPHLPTLTHDLHQLAATADTYTRAAPALLRTLGNASAISNELLKPHEKSLASMLEHTITAAGEFRRLIENNGPTLVTLVGHAKPVADVLAYYSSEFPCLVKTLKVTNTSADHALGGQGPYLKASIDLIVDRDPYTYPEDAPHSPTSDANNQNLPAAIPSWAPHCPVIPSQLRGLEDTPPYGNQLHEPLATPHAQAPNKPSDGQAQDRPEPTSAAQRREALARAVAAQQLKIDSDRVPGAATLMLEPLLQSGAVSVP